MERIIELEKAYERYRKKGYLEKALEALVEMQTLYSLNSVLAYDLCSLAIEMGKEDIAIQGLREMSKGENDPYKLLKLRVKYLKQFKSNDGQYRESLEKLYKVMYDEESVYDLGMYYYEMENYEGAKKVLRKGKRYFGYLDKGLFEKGLKKIEEKQIKKKDTSPKAERSSINQTVKLRKEYTSAQKSKAQVILPKEIEKEFEHLIGMEEVKVHMASFISELQLDKKRNELLGIESETRGYHFMLTGNPGTGKTTVARVLARVLYLIGITSMENCIEVDKSGLVGQYIGETEKRTKEVLRSAKGGVLFIDEAYTLYDKDNPKDFGRQALEVIMKAMEDDRGTLTVILAGYKKEMEMLLNANPGIQSRINFHIHIPDYADEELICIAEKIAEDRGLVITEEAKYAIIQCIEQERMDEKFGNARFIRELIDRAYRHMAIRLTSQNQENYHLKEIMQLKASDFCDEKREDTRENIEEKLQALEALTGLRQVKEKVNEMVNLFMVQKEMEQRGIVLKNKQVSSMHMLFKGNPGTGKTTVARMIGGIYKALGLLKRGDVFVEVTRGDLIGRYQGETAQKTKEAIGRAMGGILFIDEAYALVQGEGDTYGKEAIDTLIAEMENHRDKLLVILAGYNEEMNDLLESNPGFKSRVNAEIVFEDYTALEMVEIFRNIVRQEGFRLDNVDERDLEAYIEEKSKQEHFGNARGVRNIYEKVRNNQANRLAALLRSGRTIEEKAFTCIKREDIFV